MAFIDNVPTHHKALKLALGKANAELGQAARIVEEQQFGDDYFDHDCDCEYCDIMDSRRSARKLTDEELKEAKANEADLKSQVAELRKTIRGLEGYAKLLGKPIPKEEMLK